VTVRQKAKTDSAQDLTQESLGSSRFGAMALAAASLLAIATFTVFAGFTPIVPTATVVSLILLGDLIVVLALLILIGLELWRLRKARRAARAGARLHSRVIALFSMVAAIPAIVTATVATVSVEWAINPAFVSNVAGFLRDASASSQLYRESQCRVLLHDAERAASGLAKAPRLALTDPELFSANLTAQAAEFSFDATVVMRADGSIYAQAEGSQAKLVARPAPSDFDDARNGRPLCGLVAQGAVFVALRTIPGLENRFLYAARAIDPFANKVADEATAVTSLFGSFEAHRHNIELGFGVVFVMLALTMLFSAVWIGLRFANRLVAPIRRLIRAADDVASGNLDVQVPVRKSEGDLAHLGQTFNKMTQELRQQRNRLTVANALADERRAFIEAALSGVPAGVLGVTKDGVITVTNAAAERLLASGGARNSLMGRRIEAVAPALAIIVDEARAMRLRLHQGQFTAIAEGRERILNVRVTGNPQREDRGSVVTLDDISDLVTAQRTAAWADVARRIAHEIKNPLTPIQLSAERLKRRYGRMIADGKDVFDQCTDTIIRQVEDIKRMVDEFSSFARMPRARPAPDDIVDCVRQAIFLARVSRADIAFEERLPEGPLTIEFDRRLVSQALTNVLKNAGEGIDARGPGDPPRIVVAVEAESDGFVRISVSDNGKGFPAEDRHKLLEPYVTTRAEGTGLGLPIVRKICEDHRGTLDLLDGLKRSDGGVGAEVVLRLPTRQSALSVAPARALTSAPT